MSSSSSVALWSQRGIGPKSRGLAPRIPPMLLALDDNSVIAAAALGTDLKEPVLSGIDILSYDISPDEREVVYSVDRGGEMQIWVVPLDHQRPPRLLVRGAGSLRVPTPTRMHSLRQSGCGISSGFRCTDDRLARHRQAQGEMLATAPEGDFHRFQTDVYISLGRRPGRYADPHRPAAMPRSSTAPTDAIVLYTFDDAVGHVVWTKRHQHLIEHHVIQDRMPRPPQPFGEQRGKPAGTLDLVPNPPTSQVT